MVFSEICAKCDIGLMVHSALYTWKCDHCGFSYRIDPAGRWPKITILHKSNYKKGFRKK